MTEIIHAPLSLPADSRPETVIRVDRLKLSRRLWRGIADDGREFGFEVESPLRHGDTVQASDRVRYVIRQIPEPVLEIPLDVRSDAAAVIGWAVGNLHFAIEAQPSRILAPDDPGLRQSLDRIGIHYHAVVEVFQPHRFAGSLAGHGHGHDHHH